MTSSHIHLLVTSSNGPAGTEPVHAVHLGPNRYRVVSSPGFVLGVAAGDEVELLDSSGAFRVLCRSGNVAVQLFSTAPVAPHLLALEEAVSSLGGTVDGSIEHGVVCTLHHSVGFPAIEAIFNAWLSSHPGWEWGYGNVFDPTDGVTPLGWWQKPGTA